MKELLFATEHRAVDATAPLRDRFDISVAGENRVISIRALSLQVFGAPDAGSNLMYVGLWVPDIDPPSNFISGGVEGRDRLIWGAAFRPYVIAPPPDMDMSKSWFITLPEPVLLTAAPFLISYRAEGFTAASLQATMTLYYTLELVSPMDYLGLLARYK